MQILRVFYRISDGSYHLGARFGGADVVLGVVLPVFTLPSSVFFNLSKGTFAIGTSFQVYMKLNLVQGYTNARGIFGAPGIYSTATGILTVPNPIQFDATTRFLFCTDVYGVPHAYCEINGFASYYLFQSESNAFNYFGGLFRIF